MKTNFHKTPMPFAFMLMAVVLTVSMQNCAKVEFGDAGLGSAPLSPKACTNPNGCVEPEPVLPEKLALVYGAGSDDRAFLAAKIAGYQAPLMGEIFNNWRRFSSSTVYPTGTAVIPEPAYAFCFTGLNSAGNWNPGVHPTTGKTIAPGTAAECISSVSFASASWSYLRDPGRLRNATNAAAFNGFVSTFKFANYIHEAVLESSSPDNDLIGIIVAFAVGTDGAVHTLTATRTRGGAQPTLGWGLVYQRNGRVIKVLDAKSVGGTTCSNSPTPCLPGEKDGWHGRLTKIKVERQGDRISALASPWARSSAALALDSASLIEIDLSDASLGLEIFRGAQPYGYGIQSQQYAEFSEISFNSFNDDEFIYDLVNDTVYRRNATGGYSLVSGQKAFPSIGFPSLVGNVETRKEFRLNRSYTFDLMP